jgi:hypothetical protein
MPKATTTNDKKNAANAPSHPYNGYRCHECNHTMSKTVYERNNGVCDRHLVRNIVGGSPIGYYQLEEWGSNVMTRREHSEEEAVQHVLNQIEKNFKKMTPNEKTLFEKLKDAVKDEELRGNVANAVTDCHGEAIAHDKKTLCEWLGDLLLDAGIVEFNA